MTTIAKMVERHEANKRAAAVNPLPPQKLTADGRVIETPEDIRRRLDQQQSLSQSTRPATTPTGRAPATQHDKKIAELRQQIAAKESERAQALADRVASVPEKDRPFAAAWFTNEDNCQHKFAELSHYAAFQRHQARTK